MFWAGSKTFVTPSSRAVPSMSCMTPLAPAPETARASSPDSAVATALSSDASIPSLAAAWVNSSSNVPPESCVRSDGAAALRAIGGAIGWPSWRARSIAACKTGITSGIGLSFGLALRTAMAHHHHLVLLHQLAPCLLVGEVFVLLLAEPLERLALLHRPHELLTLDLASLAHATYHLRLASDL